MATTNPTTMTLYTSATSLEGSSQGVPATFNWGAAAQLLHGQTIASASFSLEDGNDTPSTDLTFTTAAIDPTGLLVQTLVGVATPTAADKQYSLICHAVLTDGTAPLLAALNIVVKPL